MITLNEQQLREVIKEAIIEELMKSQTNENKMDEFLGLSRDERNGKWGYQWDSNLSAKQNRLNRNLQKAQIKQQGYNNHDEYVAGEGHAFTEQPQQTQPVQQQQIPDEYPYKNDRQKTGQFQTWFNQNFGGQLVVDGIWGPKTEQAYKQWLAQQQ